MQKITFEDLPSTNTPINATNLNAIQTNVEGAFKNTNTTSTTDGYCCDYINECNTYSTSETFTGKYWIDGKPIYRKVINIGTISSSGTKNVAHNISNLYRVISISGYGYRSTDNVCRPLSYSEASSQIALSVDYTNVKVYTSWNPAISESYVILEYTKSS